MSKANPATAAFPVTPSDTVNFPQGTCRFLYVGNGGNIVAVIGGLAVTYLNFPGGQFLPAECSRVNSTGTTASGIVAHY
jgi:hypothetical protein